MTQRNRNWAADQDGAPDDHVADAPDSLVPPVWEDFADESETPPLPFCRSLSACPLFSATADVRGPAAELKKL
jgi:hypothetical protein